MSGLWAGWPGSGSTEPDDADEAPEFDAGACGPEYQAWLDAQRASAHSQGDMIVTEGAARAIEKGERVESLKLTLKEDALVLEAPDRVWFHLLGPLDREAAAGCEACAELREVLARVLFAL